MYFTNRLPKLIFSCVNMSFELIKKMKLSLLNSRGQNIQSFPYARSRTTLLRGWNMRRYTMRNVSFRICHFFLGFCVGLFLYCELAYVGLLPPGKPPDISIFRFLEAEESYKLEHAYFTTEPGLVLKNDNGEYHERQGDGPVSSKERVLRQNPRILCAIHVTPHLKKKVVMAINSTWGSQCDYLLFFSEGRKLRIPGEAYIRNRKAEWSFKPCWTKSAKECRYSAWNFMYSHAREHFDWVVLPQDQTKTYVVIPNLKFALSRHNSSLPLYFGNAKTVDSSLNLIDSPVQIFSKAAVREFTPFQTTHKCNVTSDYDGFKLSSLIFNSASDFNEMMKCVHKAEMGIIKPFDAKNRSLFTSSYLEDAVTSSEIDPRYNTSTGNIAGFECCSDLMIAFKVARFKRMYRYHMFINHMYPYGVSRNDPAAHHLLL